MSLVVCDKISKTYMQGSVAVHAVHEMSLNIVSHEFTALVGPSGSGKTTLLNLIGGLDIPTTGSVMVDGDTLSDLSESELSTIRLKKIGFIFQSYNLIPVFSAQENVEFIMQLQGIDTKKRSARAYEVLHQVGLSGMEHRRPAELSGGQQQRVAVARALAANPKLVLADEPTANLDSHTAASLLDLMLELNEKLGITFIFSTHDTLVMERARRIITLKDGGLVSDVDK